MLAPLKFIKIIFSKISKPINNLPKPKQI